MELTLNVYTGRLCREVEKSVTANDFELSTGICEDVLNIINIDMFEGGLEALSDESKFSLVVGVVKDGFPFFRDLIKEIFELTDDEVKRTKLSEIAKVVIDIVKYSGKQLATSLGADKRKN
jgi:hypothetical protein